MDPMHKHLLELRCLEYVLPEGTVRPIAVLLHDCTTGGLYLRFTSTWDWCDDVAAEIMSALPEDIRLKAHEMGASRLLAWMDSLSNCLRVSEPQRIVMRFHDIESELHRVAERMLNQGDDYTTFQVPGTMASRFTNADPGAWEYAIITVPAVPA